MPGFTLGAAASSHNINALWTWGGAANGKLGNATTTPDVTSPAAIGNFTDWEVLSTATNYSLGIRNGKLYAWGNNASYRTGQGTTAGDTTTPTQVGSDTGWTAAVCGAGCGFGIRDGKLYSWGSNANYRTGQGTNIGNTTAPTQIGSDTDWKFLGYGNRNGFAIKTNGTLYSWGPNTSYVTAQGTDTGDTTTPTQVGSDTDWEIAVAGFETTSTFAAAAIKGGTPFSWGTNALAATGQGTTSGTTSSPTALSGFSAATDWTSIAFGGSSAGGVGAGKLYTWGNNNSFRSGQGTSSGNTTTATQIGSNTDWREISQDALHGFALRANQIFAWGSNGNGRTGQGTTSGSTNSPTQIGSDADWKRLGSLAGGLITHNAAIKG